MASTVRAVVSSVDSVPESMGSHCRDRRAGALAGTERRQLRADRRRRPTTAPRAMPPAMMSAGAHGESGTLVALPGAMLGPSVCEVTHVVHGGGGLVGAPLQP